MWLQDSIRLASNLLASGEGPPTGCQWALRSSFGCGHPFPSISSQRTLSMRTHREALGLLYAMHWLFSTETSRGIRHSVFHDRLKDAEHVLGEWPDGNGLTGLPRKAWNHVTSNLPPTELVRSFCIRAPAVRENVGFFDMSSFGKFLVQGRDAESNEPDLRESGCGEPGKVVYTGWMKEGALKPIWPWLDCRNGNAWWHCRSGQMRDLAWLKRHTAQEDGVQVADVTSAYAVLSVMGPNSGNSFPNSPMKI